MNCLISSEEFWGRETTIRLLLSRCLGGCQSTLEIRADRGRVDSTRAPRYFNE